MGDQGKHIHMEDSARLPESMPADAVPKAVEVDVLNDDKSSVAGGFPNIDVDAMDLEASRVFSDADGDGEELSPQLSERADAGERYLSASDDDAGSQGFKDKAKHDSPPNDS